MFSTLIKGFAAILLMSSAAYAETALPALQAQPSIPETPRFSQPAVVPAWRVAVPAPDAVPAVAAAPVIEAVVPMAAPAVVALPVLAETAVPVVLRKAAPVIVVEAPARLTLDQIRRESYRFPDTSTVERFVELSTECPPLFGSDD